MIKTAYAACINIGGSQICDKLDNKYTNIGSVINGIVPFIIAIAGVLLFFILMWGGYDYLTSQGLPEKIKSANAKITSAVIGFVLLILSFLITRIISFMFGVGQGIL